MQISLPDSVGPGAALSESWLDIWFSHHITCVALDRLRIVRVDGSAQVFRKVDVDKMLAPGVGNDCRN